MAGPKLFLFDLDGTLITTGGAGARALNGAFEELYGIKSPLDTIHPSGKTDPAIFREVIHSFLHRDTSDEEIKTIGDAYLKRLKEEVKRTDQLRTLKGVAEFLEFLGQRDDVVVGLGTGNLEEGARLKLQPTSLMRHFPFGGYGSDAEDRAEVLKCGWRRAEQHAGVAIVPSQVFIIGDTVLDIAAARRAGFRVAVVASGGSSYEELNSAEPDFLMHEMTEGFEFADAL